MAWLEATAVFVSGDVGPVATVEGQYLHTLGVLADEPGKRQQLQRLGQLDLLRCHVAEQRLGFGLAVDFIGASELNVGAKASLTEQHNEACFWIVAKLTVATGRIDELHGAVDLEFVWSDVLGHIGGIFTALDIGAELAHAHDHVVAVFVLADLHHAHLARVDDGQVIGAHRA